MELCLRFLSLNCALTKAEVGWREARGSGDWRPLATLPLHWPSGCVPGSGVGFGVTGGPSWVALQTALAVHLLLFLFLNAQLLLLRISLKSQGSSLCPGAQTKHELWHGSCSDRWQNGAHVKGWERAGQRNGGRLTGKLKASFTCRIRSRQSKRGSCFMCTCVLLYDPYSKKPRSHYF